MTNVFVNLSIVKLLFGIFKLCYDCFYMFVIKSPIAYTFSCITHNPPETNQHQLNTCILLILETIISDVKNAQDLMFLD